MRHPGPVSFLLFISTASPALADPDFTGFWSVEITVAEGDCAHSRLVIAIERDTVRLAGLAAGGHSTATISRGGRVNWSLPLSSDELKIQGRLAERTGSGKWLLVSAKCAGTWRAAIGAQ